MAAQSSTRRNVILLTLLLFAQLLLMAASARHEAEATRLESWLLRLTAPAVAVSHLVTDGVHRALTSAADLLAAHARNRSLEGEVARLRSELVRRREATFENERLRNLLMMREQLVPDSIGAGVISAVMTEQTNLLVVDRGWSDGVRLDRPVVGWGGAVGRVVAIGPHEAKVQVLSDPNSEIGGMVQRSRAQGLVEGRGRDTLSLRYVPGFADVVPGDRVVTSGLAGVFPKGFVIGEVTRLEDEPDGSRSIELRPELDYRTLEEVLILLDVTAAPLLEPPAPEGASDETP